MKGKDDNVVPMERDARIRRLREHNFGFGCRGMHNGRGTLDCPHKLHHHHDIFCALPTEDELLEAGVDREEFMIFND